MMKKWIQNLVIMLISLTAGLIILELAAKIYLENIAGEKTFKQYASYRQLERRMGRSQYSQHRYLGYIPTPDYHRGKNRHNSLGYRGGEFSRHKPPGEFRIACIGGSTTYTRDVEDYRLSYPALLEKELRERGYPRVRVINAGVDGYGSWESLINFQFRILDLDPDLIIVYHAVNDIYARMVWPPSAYRGDNSGRRISNCSSEMIDKPSIMQHFNLGRILLVRLKIRPPIYDITARHSVVPETYYGRRFYLQKMKHVYPRGLFEEIRAMRMLRVNRPIYFQRNLENLVTLARANGVEVVLATFAHSPLFKDHPQAVSREFQWGFAEHNQILEEIAQSQEAHLFPFADRFPEDRKYYVDGRHVNVRGSRLKARLFADFIEERRLIPR